MRVTLLHNPEAGSGARGKKELIRPLRDAGFKVDYASTKGSGLADALDDPGDLIVIAGGDGTVSKVLRRLTRRDVPIALFPLGVANNIATSLGISGTPEAIAARLADSARGRLDLGMAKSAGGERAFVESAGLGLFAEFLRVAGGDEEADGGSNASRGRKLSQGLELLARLVPRVRGRRCRIKADGEDLSGRYVLALALNIGCVGPRLWLAPEAEAGDGKLELLLVGESRRRVLADYLGALARGETPVFPFPVKRVKLVRMGWGVGSGHLDDRLWPQGEQARQGVVTLEVSGAPFEILTGGRAPR